MVQFECGWVAVIRLWEEPSLMEVFDDDRNRTNRPSGYNVNMVLGSH